MRVAFVTPNFHQLRGNTVTVRRMTRHLQYAGVTTKVVSIKSGAARRPLPKADLVHGFHAYQFGEYWQSIDYPSTPFVITITGTDINHDLFHPKKRRTVIETLNNAEAIHVFNERAERKLLAELPGLKQKTIVIPQGVAPMPQDAPFHDKKDGTCLFLLPAGVRKVKRVPSAILMLHPLQRLYPHVRLWIAGPIIEQEEGRRVRELANVHRSWVTYLGEVPFERMGGLYRQTDVGLNTSLSEGQSSAILEMMMHGVPVLAAANDGNRDVIHPGETGLIYDSREQFFRHAERLITDPPFRKRIGRNGRQYVKQYHCPEAEAEALHRLYATIVGTKGSV